MDMPNMDSNLTGSKTDMDYKTTEPSTTTELIFINTNDNITNNINTSTLYDNINTTLTIYDKLK